MSSVLWINQDSQRADLPRISREHLLLELHPSAIAHLRSTSSEGQVPLPRLECHLGYLFGVVYTPSNTSNLYPDYDRITFVATHDRVIATITINEHSIINWSLVTADLEKTDSHDSSPSGGQFILRLFQYVIKASIDDAQYLESFLTSSAQRILGDVNLDRSVTDLIDTENLRPQERRTLLLQLRALSTSTREIWRILPRMKRVADETEEILKSLMTNDPLRDLRIDQSGVERELFSRNLEIHIGDTYLKARQLVGMFEEVDQLLTQLFQKTKQLAAEENEAAGRFTGAIASIMLLPSFIVTLYGYYFANENSFFPRDHWRFGYLYSWIMVVVVTAFQLLFFRKRRWL